MRHVRPHLEAPKVLTSHTPRVAGSPRNAGSRRHTRAAWPGAAKLRLALGSDVTLSAFEDGFLTLLGAHRLPAPRTNRDHRGDKVDCHWPGHDLTVELLSYTFHASRRAFEDDVARRRRSNHLAFTYGDVFERGRQTIAELAPRLAVRRTTRRPSQS